MRFVRFQTSAGPRWGILREESIAALDCAPYKGAQETDHTYALESVKLLPPVEPSKLICIGQNYAEHAAELGNKTHSEPMFFLKAPSSLIGPGEAIKLAHQEHSIHWEAELAVVIGRTARNVTNKEALSYVFGYTIANDVSDRDLQKADAPFGFGRAKSYDTYCPCGPVLVADGVNPLDVHISLTCNGEIKQSDRTSLMVHPVPEIVSFLSGIMTLMPGDVIMTGTPKGVGRAKPGDLLAITIPGIGTLTNPVQ